MRRRCVWIAALFLLFVQLGNAQQAGPSFTFGDYSQPPAKSIQPSVGKDAELQAWQRLLQSQIAPLAVHMGLNPKVSAVDIVKLQNNPESKRQMVTFCARPFREVEYDPKTRFISKTGFLYPSQRDALGRLLSIHLGGPHQGSLNESSAEFRSAATKACEIQKTKTTPTEIRKNPRAR